MPNTKAIGVAFSDPLLDGAVIQNSTITNAAVSGSTFDNVVIGASSGTAGFYGHTPVSKGAALTAQLTTITFTAPTTPDYAIQDFTQETPFGFVTADEANSVLSVIANLQTRVAELEARFQSYGFLP